MKVDVEFHKLIQDAQDLNTSDDYMISRLFFRIGPAEKMIESQATIKQTVGAPIDEVLEVSRPAGYSGPLNHESFRQAAELYFRTCLSRIQVNTGVRMRNNTFATSWSTSFEVEDPGKGW